MRQLIVVEALADDMATQHKQLRQYVDGVPEEELGPIRAFVEQYPEGVAQDANQDDALSWFADSSEKLASFAVGQALNSTHGKA
ncbi:hypothetical protein FPOA_12845 [Fusarium poae]|uniref:Uncharacterized protein n=1 Tax=Fusarium poae TaxID=36050 RepID=A0A1B8A7U9_FUSPO|nr:hypothetical protein FPOA_12845 [Fusarium poae]